MSTPGCTKHAQPDHLPVVTGIAPIAALIAGPVCIGVMFAIFVLVAERTAITVIGIIEAATWVRVERFASIRVLPGDSCAIAESELARFVHAAPEAFVIVITVVV